MKKHLNLPVAANHMLSQAQFPADHETPTADLGMRPVLPWDETHFRKTHRDVPMDVTKRVPHSRIRAGQMVIDTQRAKDMAENGIVTGKGKTKYDDAPVEGQMLPGGDVMLRDGHHRVVADMLRGRKTSTVHIGGRWEKPGT